MGEMEMYDVMERIIERGQKSQEQHRIRRRQVRQRELLICATVLIIGINLCGLMMMNVFANSASDFRKEPCYTSIRIENGDSLWSIAARYAESSPMDVREYVQELKRMNQLTDDTIHAGHYLTVVYYQ